MERWEVTCMLHGCNCLMRMRAQIRTQCLWLWLICLVTIDGNKCEVPIFKHATCNQLSWGSFSVHVGEVGLCFWLVIAAAARWYFTIESLADDYQLDNDHFSTKLVGLAYVVRWVRVTEFGLILVDFPPSCSWQSHKHP